MPPRLDSDAVRRSREPGAIEVDPPLHPFEPDNHPLAVVTAHTPPVTLSWLASKRARVISAVTARQRRPA